MRGDSDSEHEYATIHEFVWGCPHALTDGLVRAGGKQSFQPATFVVVPASCFFLSKMASALFSVYEHAYFVLPSAASFPENATRPRPPCSSFPESGLVLDIAVVGIVAFGYAR